MKVFVTTTNNTYDITNIVGNLEWSGNLLEIARQLVIEIPYVNQDAYFPVIPIDTTTEPSVLQLFNDDDNEIFRGVIVTEDRTANESIVYTAYDYSWYLAKNQEVFQFRNVNATDAIQQVLQSISYGSYELPEIDYVVKEFYYYESLLNIIKDILEKAFNATGKKYYMINNNGTLIITDELEILNDATTRIILHGDNYSYNDLLGDVKRRVSFEEMRNSIKVINVYKEKAILTTHTEQDTDLINNYGKLQEVVKNGSFPSLKLEAEDIAKARQTAKKVLEDKARIFESGSFTIPGNYDIISNKKIVIDEPVTGLSGEFLIESDSHTVTNGQHFTRISLTVE